MSETQWPHTLHILLNQENRMVRFPKPEGPVWTDELQRLVFKYRMFRFPKLDVPIFTA
jgi:hypothetical protein